MIDGGGYAKIASDASNNAIVTSGGRDGVSPGGSEQGHSDHSRGTRRIRRVRLLQGNPSDIGDIIAPVVSSMANERGIKGLSSGLRHSASRSAVKMAIISEFCLMPAQGRTFLVWGVLPTVDFLGLSSILSPDSSFDFGKRYEAFCKIFGLSGCQN